MPEGPKVPLNGFCTDSTENTAGLLHTRKYAVKLEYPKH